MDVDFLIMELDFKNYPSLVLEKMSIKLRLKKTCRLSFMSFMSFLT